MGILRLVNKIVIGLKSICLDLHYRVVNLLKNKKLHTSENSNISISLTSYGKRIDKVFLTIESIFSQKGIELLSVTLWLSKKDIGKNYLPPSLKRLERRGLRIKLVDENIKSYKKIYYEYIERKSNENAIIVTADDDVFYPPFWLKSMYLAHLKNKNSVICHRGHFIKAKMPKNFDSYVNWTETFETDYSPFCPQKSLLPTGVGGVMYPVQSLYGLDKQLGAFLEYCPTADDIWFKLTSLKNNFGAIRISNKNIHFLPVLSFNMKGLELHNINEGGNDTQFNRALVFYKIGIDDFK